MHVIQPQTQPALKTLLCTPMPHAQLAVRTSLLLCMREFLGFVPSSELASTPEDIVKVAALCMLGKVLGKARNFLRKAQASASSNVAPCWAPITSQSTKRTLSSHRSRLRVRETTDCLAKPLSHTKAGVTPQAPFDVHRTTLRMYRKGSPNGLRFSVCLHRAWPVDCLPLLLLPVIS